MIRRLCLCFATWWLLLAPGAEAAKKLHLRPPLWVDPDDRAIPEPKEREVSELYAIVYNTWLRHLSPQYKAEIARDPGALNVNAWDEVPDSSWFTNRIGRSALSLDEIANGIEGQRPEPAPWKVLRVNDEGYTPKFDIQDSAGRRYVLKFDLPTALERNSAAERICTLIMHAAGYHVPHNSIVYFRREELQLDEKSYYRDSIGKRRPMTQQDLENAFQKLKALPDGRYRGLASLYLPGPPVGRFKYFGTRQDDPNDLIPHELRRELRGMRVIASWINHADVKDVNALDVYFTASDGRKYIKHYMLDFGSTMGSGDFVNGPFRVGHEYIFDGPAIAKAFLTLGIWRRPWDARGEIRYPEVGYYPTALFEPEKWKPNYPNLSFERMDDADAYWGAKIVTAFSDDTIRRLAESGDYSRAEVTKHIASVLLQRRNAIGRYWLERITPLEELRLERTEGKQRLRFRDLALERGYADANGRAYRFWVEDLRGSKLRQPATVKPAGQGFELPPVPEAKSAAADRFGRTPVARLLIQSSRRDGGWALPVEVILGFAAGQSVVEVLGWSHAAR